MPLYDQPIQNPVLDGQRRPLNFRWRGQVVHVVEIIDRFILTGEWWEHKPEQVWWRLRVKGGGVFELCHKQIAGGRWFLYMIYD